MAAPTPAAEAARKKALIESIMAMEVLERQAARGNMPGVSMMEAWTRRYLPGLFFAAPGSFHRALYSDALAMLRGEDIGGEERTAAAMACPRGHGKSTAMVIGLPLMIALEWARFPFFNRAKRAIQPYIVIVSDTIDQARSRIMDIRDELMENEALIAAYGYQGPVKGERKRKWTETHLELRNGVVIRAMGWSGKVRGLVRRGRRPNIIIADDMENDKAVETSGQRKKLRRWFTQALIPCGKAGELLTFVVGTILHADSLLARFISDDHFPGWLKRRYAAQYNDKTGMPDPDGDGILWPEYWTREQLAKRRREIGTLAYSQEYLNQAIDDESAIFRWDWLQSAKRRGSGIPFLYDIADRIPWSAIRSTWDPVRLAELAPSVSAYQLVVTAWDLAYVEDPAKAKAKDSDYVVGVTVGLTVGDRFHVRRIWRRRGVSPAQRRQRIIEEQQIVGADFVAIEVNAAQRDTYLDLKQIPGLGDVLVEHLTTKAKSSIWDGVPSMALMFEAGRIDLCHRQEVEAKRIDTMIGELHGLGLEAHDDTVMALWMAVSVIRRWIRQRNKRRIKAIGPAPPGYYVDPFPVRDTDRRAA